MIINIKPVQKKQKKILEFGNNRYNIILNFAFELKTDQEKIYNYKLQLVK